MDSNGTQTATRICEMSEFTPSLHVAERSGRVQLGLGSFGYAEGPTLQDAADELVRKMLLLAMAIRSGELAPAGWGLRPDPAAMAFLWEIGRIASEGGDIRQRLFGPDTQAA